MVSESFNNKVMSDIFIPPLNYLNTLDHINITKAGADKAVLHDGHTMPMTSKLRQLQTVAANITKQCIDYKLFSPHNEYYQVLKLYILYWL